MLGLDLGNLLVHIRGEDLQFQAVIARSKAALLSLQARAKTTAKVVAAAGLIIGGAGLKAYASFDDAMVRSTAIMGELADETEDNMRRIARSLARDGIQSAKQLADSYFYLASAGLDAQQSMAALPVVQAFATAGAFDMARATDLVTDAQSALGLTVRNAAQNMKNMSRVADVLVRANTLANASTEQFSVALTTQAGPALKAYKVSIEEGVAVLAGYADQGIKAERAGSMFSRMLRLMTRGFNENRQAWARFGLTIWDARGNLRPIADIVRDLTSALGAMSTESKTVALDMLGFQARSQQAILPLLGMADRIARYFKELKQAAGVNLDVAAKQLRSFGNQLRIMWNQLKDVAIGIGEVLAPHVLRLNETIQKGLRWWYKLDIQVRTMTIEIGALASVCSVATLAMGGLLKMMKWLAAPILKLTGLTNVWVLAVIAAVAIVYALRAAWKQGAEQIKQNMEALAVVFQDTWEWLANTLIGNLLVQIVMSFKRAFDTIRLGWREFIADIASGVIGATKWIAAMGSGIKKAWTNLSAAGAIQDLKDGIAEANEAFAVGFTEAWQVNKEQADAFAQYTKEKFETVPLYLKAVVEGYGETVKSLGEAMRAQFKEDMDWLIEYFNLAKRGMTEQEAKQMVTDKAIEKLKQAWSWMKKTAEEAYRIATMPPPTWLDKLIFAGKQFKRGFADEIKEMQKELEQDFNTLHGLGSRVAREWRDGMVSATTDAIMGIEDLNDALREVGLSIARIGIEWATAQLYTAAFSALGSALNIGGAAGAAGGTGTAAAGVAHSGGVPGVDTLPTRIVPASVFATAVRAHTGIGPGERPVIMRNDEGVFTKGQMRAMGGSKKDTTLVRVLGRLADVMEEQKGIDVLLVDKRKGAEDYLSTRQGKRQVIELTGKRQRKILE